MLNILIYWLKQNSTLFLKIPKTFIENSQNEIARGTVIFSITVWFLLFCVLCHFIIYTFIILCISSYLDILHRRNLFLFCSVLFCFGKIKQNLILSTLMASFCVELNFEHFNGLILCRNFFFWIPHEILMKNGI